MRNAEGQAWNQNSKYIEEHDGGILNVKWPGLVPLTQRLFYGSKDAPKATYSPGVTSTTSREYENMNQYYRWFRQNELVRGCTVTNAFFACMSQGFETVLEPGEPQELSDQEKEKLLEDHVYVKAKIDELNKRANLDQVLFIAQAKRSIYGKCGFEIVVDKDLVPEKLLLIESTSLKPKLNDYWELTAFEYKGKSHFYLPEEALRPRGIPAINLNISYI